MKQIKFRHLATLGLCCSLLANSFTGITAIAETVPIESSPTAESSAKEETPASSVKEETTKASTQNSQVTTDTSREEETKEAEKQAETEVPTATPEVKTDTAEQAPANSSVNDLQKSISPRWVPNQVIYPRMTFGFTDETGKAFADETLTLSGTYTKFLDNATTQLYQATDYKYPIVSSHVGGGQYRVTVNAAVPMPYDFFTNFSANYRQAFYAVEQLKIDNTLKYVESIVAPPGSLARTTYNTQQVSETVQFGNNGSSSLLVRDRTFSKNSANTFSIISTNQQIVKLMLANRSNATLLQGPNLLGFDGTRTYRGTINYVVTRKQVTEKFVDGTGVAITPPTGFTQNKKTPMTNNNFTYTSAEALPETYRTSGKTYKFKGWYKGKTKPATLKTTKTPSYAVTYDDNDDLNVVYEEIEAFDFPEFTYQFGFVDESGKRVDASTIGLTYDKWYGELFTNNINDWKPVSLEKGQIAPTKNNLKEIVYPAQSVEILSGRTAQYGAANLTFTLPKYYEKISVYNKSGTFDTAYPFPNIQNNNYSKPYVEDENKLISRLFELKNNGGQSFIFNQTFGVPIDIHMPHCLNVTIHNPSTTSTVVTYYTIDKPIYYHLTNRKVTENFVDASGAKLPSAPTGFTQGNKVVIDSENFTYTSPKALPDTYKVGDKTYKFKGWYKGKNKPTTLETSKTPSYKVTYDDNDDLNVVYEVDPAKDYKFPSRTVNFQFVNEAGTIISPTPFTITTDLQQEINSTYTKLGSITGTNSGNTKQVTIPAKTIRADVSLGGVNNYGTTNTTITIPKFYENISVYAGSAYTQATLNKYLTVNNALTGTPASNAPLYYGLNKVTATQFKVNEYDSTNATMPERSKYLYNRLYVAGAANNFNSYYTTVGTVYYQLTNRKVTENFVDASGAKITPPTGFTQGNQIPMTSDTFKYTAAKALPTSYTADGKTYLFQGWYKGKTKPNTLTTSTTPTYDTTFDDNDDMTAVYKEASISANLTMRGAVDVIDNGGTMEYWEVLLKNTGEAPLTSIKIKPTTEWESGISTPTELFILGTGQNTKVRPITKEQWEAGFEIPLDKSLPVGGQLTINLIGTKVTGQPNQVLKAAVEVSGNFNKLTASDTVRIKDLDQETKEPTGEGFISVPTFDFSQVGVASATKQHGLKKAADYYGNGTRNPYVRISKNQPNWSLTAQLSQPKSATDSLPTATRLLLGAAPVSSFSNYNQPTELKNTIGTTNAINLTANNAATSIIANQQFTGSDVYQLDFTFDNIKLEVPANQGTAGQQYQAAVTWNLVTGP